MAFSVPMASGEAVAGGEHVFHTVLVDWMKHCLNTEFELFKMTVKWW